MIYLNNVILSKPYEDERMHSRKKTMYTRLSIQCFLKKNEAHIIHSSYKSEEFKNCQSPVKKIDDLDNSKYLQSVLPPEYCYKIVLKNNKNFIKFLMSDHTVCNQDSLEGGSLCCVAFSILKTPSAGKEYMCFYVSHVGIMVPNYVPLIISTRAQKSQEEFEKQFNHALSHSSLFEQYNQLSQDENTLFKNEPRTVVNDLDLDLDFDN